MYRKKLRGMYISKEALKEQFDPRNYPLETYLLCELRWGKSERFWIHWLRNDNSKDYHAEEYFLEKIFKPKHSSVCYMTWYLSWSPCVKCCYKIRDFLKRHPNVNLDICVARVYYADSEETYRGLRALHSLQGVTIKVMEIKAYYYCWDTFIQRDVHYDFSPANFPPAIAEYRLKLKKILEDYLKLNNMTKSIIQMLLNSGRPDGVTASLGSLFL